MIVDCDMRKWPDRPHWHFRARLLGRDRYGTWLGSTPQTAYTGPYGAGAWPQPFVCVIPEHAWWVATFNGWPGNIETYVDMTTPARWHGSHVVAIDLDLDVARRRDGRVLGLDEDEFDDHRVRYGYPDAVVDAARRTFERLQSAVRHREEPFRSVGRRWLARL